MKTLEIQPRDLDLFHFLWRWKLVSAAAIGEKFFPRLSPITPFLRLRKLEAAGFLRFQFEGNGKRGAWTLDRKGFNYLKFKNRLPCLEEDGFRSEHYEHDALVSAVHLGDWLLSSPTNAAHFTEQELRRFRAEDYPSWIPSATAHRPDGYWRVPYGKQGLTIALEVELNVKDNSDYDATVAFYNEEVKVFRILWMVPQSNFNRVHRKVTENNSRKEPIHNFVTVEDFRKGGWGTVIRSGTSQGKTISYLLSAGLQQSYNICCTPLLLDMRKSATRYASYGKAARAEI